MELTGKGQTAELDTITSLRAVIKWSVAADFDLGALIRLKSGGEDFIYFGNKGDLNKSPFVKLDKDAGVRDTAGDNSESLKVAKLDDIKELHLFVWDFGQVTQGLKARFEGSDLKITITDNTNASFEAPLATSDVANVVLLATIDNSSPIGAKLTNVSKAATLKGFTNSDQLWAIVNSK